ncbi:MAG: hypothetical protein ACYTGX_13310 [Planctomycetota bacterium]|jgi:hypothetical protein
MGEPVLPAEPAAEETAHQVWLAWEKLRVIYNVILLLETTVLAGKMFTTPRGLGFLVGAAIGANLCFCAGPVLEGYLRVLQMPRRIARWLLFIGGCIIAVVVAFLAILSEAFAGMP